MQCVLNAAARGCLPTVAQNSPQGSAAVEPGHKGHVLDTGVSTCARTSFLGSL